MTLRWRIYYGDGSTFDGRDGPASDAPARDVQMIAVADPDHGWYLVRSTDYYWWLPNDTWNGGDIFGLFDYLIEPGLKRVLFGRTIETARFRAIFDRAMNDPEIPQKTGWWPRERESGGIA